MTGICTKSGRYLRPISGCFFRPFLATILGLSLAGCLSESRSIDVSDITIIDGDTIQIAGVRHRLLGFDTPEIFSPSCEQELRLGQLAKARLAELVFAQTEVQITSELRPDQYGRTLSVLTIDGLDVADVLVSEGLAHRYSGGLRASWC